MTEVNPQGISTATSSQLTGAILPPAIRALNLTKSYGKRTVVDHLNFTVNSGELYALLGDNGAGKTTTISMLTTLLSPDAGEFYIAGFNGVKQSEKAKAAFGVVSQDVAVYLDLTAYENLSFIADLYRIPRKVAEARIAVLLEEALLSDRATDKVGEFSGGMQRKLSIAMAVLPKPHVLFLDEPTVGLDPAARRQIWTSLKELKKQGVTILLTTHYLEEAEMLADRIGIIREGKIVQEGTIGELREKIQSIRSVVVRLSQQIDDHDLNAKLKPFLSSFPTIYNYDRMRQTLALAQPRDIPLPHYLNAVLGWLDTEKIAFSKFATSEPNLEELFLAVSSGKSAVTSDFGDN